MIGVVLVCSLLAVKIVDLFRRRDHRPRAIHMRVTPKPTPKMLSFATAVTYGLADFSTGKCTKCGRYWRAYCRTGECGDVHVNDRAPGPGVPCSR